MKKATTNRNNLKKSFKIRKMKSKSIFSVLLVFILIMLFLKSSVGLRYWNALQFSLREMPILKNYRCSYIRELSDNSREVKIDTDFIKKDYPQLFQKDVPHSVIEQLELNSPKSLYKLDKVGRSAGYITVDMFEYLSVVGRGSNEDLPEHMRSRRFGNVWHIAVYARKGWGGQYRRVDYCRKHLG
ncbi:MAG: hypothetical protein AAGG51_09790 [Cyanobacteria bacterium P01_G01_bin.54]